MIKVALTGGIATGKSHVLDRLQTLGVACVDADDLAHGVMRAGTEATAAIEARFGPSVLTPDGDVDRRTLGRLVFRDAEARRDLEGMVHPAVYRAVDGALRGFERLGGTDLAVVAIPLLYETGRAGDFAVVVATTCSEGAQLDRLLARGLTAEEARQRLTAQMPAAEKAARADFVIDTSGTFEETDRQVGEILEKLRRRPPAP
jgi:dephospho-CoA kinase